MTKKFFKAMLIIILLSTAAFAGYIPGIAPASENYLILGADKRPGEGYFRTDVILLAHVNRGKGSATLVSIPRDTRVKLAKYGWRKINDAYGLGGPEATQEAVESLLKVKVKGYMLWDFQNFIKIVDVLGGIDLDIEKDMVHDDVKELAIHLKKGPQHLNGSQALGYVRFRGDPLGDLARVERQQKFLVALAEQIKSPLNLLKIPQITSIAIDTTETNLKAKDMALLLPLAPRIDLDSIRRATLPGAPGYISGISYYLVDEKKAYAMLNQQ